MEESFLGHLFENKHDQLLKLEVNNNRKCQIKMKKDIYLLAVNFILLRKNRFFYC